jgi:hypothetical protein
MAEVRCPTCGKNNPAELEYCQSCGTKLPNGSSIHPGDEPIKRSTAEFEGASISGDMTAIHPGEEPTKKNTGELERALPAWLRDLRGKKDQVTAGEPPVTTPDETPPAAPAAPSTPPKPSTGSIDWLAGLNASGEEEEIPDWLTSIGGKGKEEPSAAPKAQPPAPAPTPEADWLSQLGASAQESKPAPSISQPAEPEPATGLPDWFSSLRSEPEPVTPAEAAPETAPETEPDTGLGNWLAGLDRGSAVGTPAEPAPAEDDWMTRLKEETSGPETGSEIPRSDVPDWLSGLPATPSAPEEKVAPAVEPAAEFPDWLSRLQPGGASAETPQAAPEEDLDWLKNLPAASDSAENAEPAAAPAENLDWLNNLQAPSAPAESAPAQALPGEMPDWLKSLQPPQETPAEEPVVKPKPFKTGTLPPVGSDVPGWLSSVEIPAPAPVPLAPEPPAKELPPAAIPDWISGGKSGPSVLKRVPSGQPEPAGTFPMDQPDWLSSLKPDQAEATPTPKEPAEEGEPEALQRGELPSWVQAMRPVADVVADANVTAEPAQSDQPIEERGPLAGLRGVLPVGVGIGLTRKPPAYSIKLQVGESQQRHSARLERSIASESEPGALRSAARVSSAHILRWIVAAVLLLTIVVTVFSGVDLGMSGAVYPPEMVAAMNLVSGLQPGAPILVVFDYQPALSGELEAAAAPMMDDLLFKSIRLTILSTTPTGPALAERFMQNTQAQHAYKVNEQYVNLGYLAGGPAGVLDFAAEPSVASPFTVDGKNAWTLSPLQGVQELSDFALILILTDDADTGRVWIEQAGPELGATPMAMVISAQTEPMIRPYYDSGQIKGLVTGLAGGHAYEQGIQRPGLGGKYWNAFGLAMLMAEIMIVVGAVWSAISALRERRAVKEGGA